MNIGDSRLILVEGIPGAGKTTMAGRLKEELTAQGRRVIAYTEGESHPADMAWQAYLTPQEYAAYRDHCRELWESLPQPGPWEAVEQALEAQTRREDGHILLAYTRVAYPDDAYWALTGEVACKEICDRRRPLEEFKAIHLRRWARFAREAEPDAVYIFECAFLQNHIFELMGQYEKSDEEILAHLKELLDTVRNLNPRVVYLRPKNIAAAIDHVTAERVSGSVDRPDWIDEIGEWVENTPYGHSHNLHGREGVVAFCTERVRVDEMALAALGVPVDVIER
ncbi:MAG: hypothetical protein PHD32_10045 [Eubacteriales bacterium]|nr:hypothetical protein [Eubacteriales bacterium]